MDFIVSVLVGIIVAATPLLFAALGELVVEKSGVLNLGVEGHDDHRRHCRIRGDDHHWQPSAGVLAAIVGGMLMSLIFAVMTQTLLANQVATGLALTLFGLGLSALIGQSYSGISGGEFPHLDIPGLSDLPVVGPLLFSLDYLVYLSIALTIGVWWFLYRTRTGLIAAGDRRKSRCRSCDRLSGRALPLPARSLFGGALAGLGGAYLSDGAGAAVGREDERRARLDRAGTGGVRGLAAVPCAWPAPICSAASRSCSCTRRRSASRSPRSTCRCCRISRRSSFSC